MVAAEGSEEGAVDAAAAEVEAGLLLDGASVDQQPDRAGAESGFGTGSDRHLGIEEWEDETMTPERWRTIRALLAEALEQEPHHRRTWIEEICPDDERIRSEVGSLLDAHDRAGTFIERPLARLVAPGWLLGRTSV
ncbi:MAG: hypothetical protein SX243_06640 [Acidobacteriota bacterium]|nr:hypothetical protein [Acidobacteriota bacterium]